MNNLVMTLEVAFNDKCDMQMLSVVPGNSI